MSTVPFTSIDENVLHNSTNTTCDLSCLPFYNSHNVHVPLENDFRQATAREPKIINNNCFNNYDRSHLSDIDPDNNYINNNVTSVEVIL